MFRQWIGGSVGAYFDSGPLVTLVCEMGICEMDFQFLVLVHSEVNSYDSSGN